MLNRDKLLKIKLLLLDVDGVLTDGTINYDNNGNEIKSFNVKDGLGLRLLMDSGVEVGIITGRSSDALKHRLNNLGIKHLFDGVKDKIPALEEILNQFKMEPENAFFIGDDLPDIPVMKRVGLCATVNDAHSEVKRISDYVSTFDGGKGAVREICEKILEAKGLLQDIYDRYLK